MKDRNVVSDLKVVVFRAVESVVSTALATIIAIVADSAKVLSQEAKTNVYRKPVRF